MEILVFVLLGLIIGGAGVYFIFAVPLQRKLSSAEGKLKRANRVAEGQASQADSMQALQAQLNSYNSQLQERDRQIQGYSAQIEALRQSQSSAALAVASEGDQQARLKALEESYQAQFQTLQAEKETLVQSHQAQLQALQDEKDTLIQSHQAQLQDLQHRLSQSAEALQSPEPSGLGLGGLMAGGAAIAGVAGLAGAAVSGLWNREETAEQPEATPEAEMPEVPVENAFEEEIPEIPAETELEEEELLGGSWIAEEAIIPEESLELTAEVPETVEEEILELTPETPIAIEEEILPEADLDLAEFSAETPAILDEEIVQEEGLDLAELSDENPFRMSDVSDAVAAEELPAMEEEEELPEFPFDLVEEPLAANWIDEEAPTETADFPSAGLNMPAGFNIDEEAPTENHDFSPLTPSPDALAEDIPEPPQESWGTAEMDPFAVAESAEENWVDAPLEESSPFEVESLATPAELQAAEELATADNWVDDPLASSPFSEADLANWAELNEAPIPEATEESLPDLTPEVIGDSLEVPEDFLSSLPSDHPVLEESELPGLTESLELPDDFLSGIPSEHPVLEESELPSPTESFELPDDFLANIPSEYPALDASGEDLSLDSSGEEDLDLLLSLQADEGADLSPSILAFSDQEEGELLPSLTGDLEQELPLMELFPEGQDDMLELPVSDTGDSGTPFINYLEATPEKSDVEFLEMLQADDPNPISLTQETDDIFGDLFDTEPSTIASMDSLFAESEAKTESTSVEQDLEQLFSDAPASMDWDLPGESNRHD